MGSELYMIPEITWSNGVAPEAFESPISYEDLVIPANQGVVSFAALPQNGVLAVCSVDGNDVRYRLDGGPPSNVSGHLIPQYSFIRIYGRNNLQAVQFCAASGVAATLRVTHYIIHVPDLEQLLALYPGLP